MQQKARIEGKTIYFGNIKYELLDVIGNGAYAKVHRAKKYVDNNMNPTEVAIRCQRRHFSDDFNSWELLKKLKWPHTTYPIENFAIGQSLYTEFILYDGNLQQLSQQDINNNLEQIIKEIGEALLYIHKDGKIHFDVKPDNIVYRQINQKYEFALCDFSSLQSKIDDENKEVLLATTPAFSAPEINWKGHTKGFNEKSDVWAFCLTIYYLYKGELLFHEGNLDQIGNQLFIDDAINNLTLEKYKQALLQGLKVDKSQRCSIQEFLTNKNKEDKPFIDQQTIEQPENHKIQEQKNEIPKEYKKQFGLAQYITDEQIQQLLQEVKSQFFPQKKQDFASYKPIMDFLKNYI